MILLYASVRHQKLTRFNGLLGTLQMIEDVAFNRTLLLLFFDLIPDFGEAAVVATTEVLAGYDAIGVKRRERRIQSITVRRGTPSRLLGLMNGQRLASEPFDLNQQIVATVFFVCPMLGVLDDLVGRLEAFSHASHDELGEVVEDLDHDATFESERWPSTGTRELGHHVKYARSRTRVHELVMRLPEVPKDAERLCVFPFAIQICTSGGSTASLRRQKGIPPAHPGCRFR